MTAFQYPKTVHKRVLAPKSYKRYQTYKRLLQFEFSRVCVYCRQPDSSAPNLNFGVDHYRPKSDPRFTHLASTYDNLYYCCGSCNSRKNDYWPTNEVVGPHIVNPCIHKMTEHLAFDSNTGRFETRSKHGSYTEELLQLNDKDLVAFRRNTIYAISRFNLIVMQLQDQLAELPKILRAGKITQHNYALEERNILNELNDARAFLHRQLGTLPLPQFKKKYAALS